MDYNLAYLPRGPICERESGHHMSLHVWIGLPIMKAPFAPDAMTTYELRNVREELKRKLAPGEMVTPINRRRWEAQLQAIVAEQERRADAEEFRHGRLL